MFNVSRSLIVDVLGSQKLSVEAGVHQLGKRSGEKSILPHGF